MNLHIARTSVIVVTNVNICRQNLIITSNNPDMFIKPRIKRIRDGTESINFITENKCRLKEISVVDERLLNLLFLLYLI